MDDIVILEHGRPLTLLAATRQLMRPRRGLFAFGLILVAINRICALVVPASAQVLIDEVVVRRRLDLLRLLVPVVFVATIIEGCTSIAVTTVFSKAAVRLIGRLRCQVQAHIGRLPIVYHDHYGVGALVSRIMHDVDGIPTLVGGGLVELVGGLMMSALSLTLMLFISPSMTAMNALILFVFAFLLVRVIDPFPRFFQKYDEIHAQVCGRLAESIMGVRIVKAFHAELGERAVFATGVARLLDSVFKTVTAMSIISVMSPAVLGAVAGATVAVGAWEILEGHLTLGEFVTYTLLLGFAVVPLSRMVIVATQLSEAVAGLERTREILNQPSEDQYFHREVRLSALRGAVVFDDVSFAYDSRRLALSRVSFRADPGTVTALVGPSGSGKSTIGSIIAAFYAPTSGRVLVDGVDLGTVQLESYRSHVAIVLQDTFLFSASIRENIAFSRPEATSEELVAACRLARVDAFAEALPQGYDTIVGERGVRLSGGQRQRVSLARAILADARLLILDEAFSSIDSESERMIQEALSCIIRDRTMFVIAHRVSTVQRANQILVLDEGRITERGRHAELMALGKWYATMYSRQHQCD